MRGFCGAPVTPSSAPQLGARPVVILGRRVDVGVQDSIRANGPRVPRAITDPPSRYPDGARIEDASFPTDETGAGLIRETDCEVLWVLHNTLAVRIAPSVEDRAPAGA